MERSSWQDRVPFVLLLEIATSISLFQEKLPQGTTRYLHGTSFETRGASDSMELVFRAVTAPVAENRLWVGAGLCRLILDRQSEHVQSAETFIRVLKV